MESAQEKTFTTSDGVQLSYLEAGQGTPLVMIHGWSQSAIQWKHQIDALSAQYHVIAVDLRGHGASAKPAYGYKIHRLSKDIHELLAALDLKGAVLMGHSMGCTVIWGYVELFGNERLSKLILVDESPFLTSNPGWSAQELEDSGELFDPAAVTGTANALAGADGDAVTRGFIGGMVTKACPPDVLEWMIQQNFKMPRAHAATLLYNHCHQDWRDLIPRITLPALVITGRVSLVPWKSNAWIAGQIPGAKLVVFEEAEGGQHFMFVENPEKFNAEVSAFIDG
jgi:non-heme chloroperoxidase